MGLLPAYEIYIDESNVPVFSDSKKRDDAPYVVCAIVIPILAKQDIELLLPRDKDGQIMKSSSPDLTDTAAAQFINNLMVFDVLFSIVVLDTKDKENCEIANSLTNNANRNRRKKIRQANLMYIRTAAEAIITVLGSNKISFFDIIFDSNSLPRNEFELFKNILKVQFAHRGVKIRDITQKTEQQESLLLAADIIAGVGRRWDTHKDVPQSWSAILKGQGSGKVFIRNGFEIFNAD